MKRRTLRYLVPVAALLAAAGCDYKESFPYQGDELIDFTTDSLYFSFGKEPFSVTEKMMEVGVEIVGSPVSHDRGYRIRIDPLRTTAQAGQHYDALEETRTIPAGASSTTIPVRVHRLELEDETVYTLRLELVETEDFRLGVIEGRAVSVCFTKRNYRTGSVNTTCANIRNSSNCGAAPSRRKTSRRTNTPSCASSRR